MFKHVLGQIADSLDSINDSLAIIADKFETVIPVDILKVDE